MSNIDQNRLNIQFLLPLNEIVTSFYDDLKSISSGYASFDYEDAGYQKSELLKLGEWHICCLIFWNVLVIMSIIFRRVIEREAGPRVEHDLPREQGEGPRQGRGVQAEEWAAQATVLHRNTGQYG